MNDTLTVYSSFNAEEGPRDELLPVLVDIIAAINGRFLTSLPHISCGASTVQVPVNELLLRKR